MVEERRRRWPNVVLLIVSIGLTLAVLEVVARRLLPLDPYEIVPDQPDGEPIGVRHPTRGHSLRPGFSGRFVHPDFGGEKVVINRFGFRDRGPDAGKQVDGLKVTVLGDSVAFGTGVEATATFSARLEEILGQDLDRSVRVFNTGVAGYGPLHELVVLREEYDRQVPDVAVIAFYTGNDLQDTYGFYREHGAVVDLLSLFGRATTKSKRHVGKNVLRIDGESRKILSAHPDAEIRFPLKSEWLRPDAMLRFGVTLKPDSWDQPGADGVRFEVLLESGGQVTTLYDQHVDPHRAPELRGWNDRQVTLPAAGAGDATLVLRTTAGPKGSLDYDWAVWVTPHIFFGGAADVLGGEQPPSRLLMKPVFESYWKRATSEPTGRLSRVYWEQRSSLFKLVAGRLDNLSVRWGLKPPKAIFSYHLVSSFDREMSEGVRAALDMTMRAVGEMQSFMAARGGRVILLLIPAKFQTEPETVRRFVERAGFDPQRIDVDQPHRVLRGFCARSAVTCVDLLPELRRRVAAGERVYFPEGHPNRLGHRIIAQHLAAAVAARQ